MSLNTVTLKWDLTDLIEAGLSATLSITPTAQLSDSTDHILIPPVARTCKFSGGTGQLAGIVANDNSSLLPTGTGYLISVSTQAGVVIVPQFQTQLLFSNGATQWLDALAPVPVVATGYLPPAVSSVALAVAAANSSAKNKAAADYVCTGTSDDVTVNKALDALPSGGGIVTLLAGDYYLGTGSGSFLTVPTSGTTLQGQGRLNGATIHAPAGFTAPAAIKVTAASSCTIRDLCVLFDAPSTLTANGIWTLCNEAHLQNIEVQYAPGTAFIMDGPDSLIWNCRFTDCTAVYPGSGNTTDGDGFRVTANAWNSILTDCFVIGGQGDVNGAISPTGLLTTALTSGSVYTSLAVAGGMQGPVTAGDKIILVSPDTNLGASTVQVVTASSSAITGATSIAVNSFTANANYAANWTAVVDKTTMPCRYGINLAGPATHLNNCHPYRCYESALTWTGAAGKSVFVIGGEYETCGWSNINLNSVGQGILSGVYSYGPVAYAAVRLNSCEWLPVTGCVIDGNTGIFGFLMQFSTYCQVTGNSFVNGVGTSGICAAFSGCDHCAVTGNTTSYWLSGSPANSFLIFNCTSCTVTGNQANTHAASVAGTNTGTIIEDNLGLSPIATVYASPLATNTALTADSAAHTLVTSASIPPGRYLLMATLTLEFNAASNAYADFGVALGTASGTLTGMTGGAMSQPAAGTEFISYSAVVSCVADITAAGTVILQYYATGAAVAIASGVNHSFGPSTGITLTAL